MAHVAWLQPACTGIAAVCIAFSVEARAMDSIATDGDINNCLDKAAASLSFNGVALARRNNDVIERNFGTSDAAQRVAISDETRFNIGSASKMFTAVAIGQLIDEGRLQFDAPIGRYLAGLEPDVAVITVEQLLNHTSGLGNYFKPENSAAVDAARTAGDLLPLALQPPLAFAPGTKRAYSNSGFVVLGAIIERISRMSYSAYVQASILDPLDMVHTRFEPDGSAEPMTRLSPRGLLDSVVPAPTPHRYASPAGGMFSTARDLSLFLTALANGRLVSASTLNELLRPRTDPSGATGEYALGFNSTDQPRRRVGHGGGAPGVNAQVTLYPDSATQVIVLSNYDPPTAEKMADVIERALFSPDPSKACSVAVREPVVSKYSIEGGHAPRRE